MFDKIYSCFTEFNEITVIIRILLATFFGGLIGSERGRHGRPAGLRTHILVCIGAAMTSLTSIYLSETMGYTGDVARLSAQVISGIGFLGAGTIMIRNSSVITGLTTAAGMWATAAIGIAVGYGFYSASIIATLVCIFSVTVLSRLEKRRKNTFNVYIEITDISVTGEIIEKVSRLENAVVSYDVISPKSGQNGNVGILFILHGHKYFQTIKEMIVENKKVVMIIKDLGI